MTPEEARAIAAPQQPGMDWPLSEEARKWVASVEKFERRRQEAQREQFNRAEHERFMKSLG